ncbi:hypothetical protein Tco_1013161 [Tanacetum coccineum]
MSMYRVPMGVLNRLESTRRDFFNGAENKERKLSLIAWKKNLSPKSKGGLGISSIFAQNRALMLKWIWRFMSNDSSLWSCFIKAMFGARGSLVDTVSFHWRSNWLDIIREFQSMSRQGLNLLSHAKLKVGDGMNTSFWNDVWLAESPLNLCYPRLFALEDDKLVSVSDKLQAPSLLDSFRMPPRGGIEDSQLTSLAQDLADVVLSSKKDSIDGESSSHIFFNCHVARDLLGKVARWWELELLDIHVYEDWLSWFITLRLSKRLKDILEGVFYTLWWSIWRFRNHQVVFRSSRLRLDYLFDEVVQMSYNWCSSRSNCHLDR